MSIVRENIMDRQGYSPYCGNANGGCDMPRTNFDGEQFKCPHCGWRSGFEPEFIAAYKAKWSIGTRNRGRELAGDRFDTLASGMVELWGLSPADAANATIEVSAILRQTHSDAGKFGLDADALVERIVSKHRTTNTH